MGAFSTIELERLLQPVMHIPQMLALIVLAIFVRMIRSGEFPLRSVLRGAAWCAGIVGAGYLVERTVYMLAHSGLPLPNLILAILGGVAILGVVVGVGLFCFKAIRKIAKLNEES